MMTERGSVTVDERTNTLLINDTVDQLENIRALVHRLDVPIRQVLIESRIVIASDAFNKDIGVRWGLNRNTSTPMAAVAVADLHYRAMPMAFRI